MGIAASDREREGERARELQLRKLFAWHGLLQNQCLVPRPLLMPMIWWPVQQYDRCLFNSLAGGGC